MNAGLGLRVFTDEMIRPRLAAELRRRGYDVLSCRAAGRVNQSISDEDQLVFAAGQGVPSTHAMPVTLMICTVSGRQLAAAMQASSSQWT